MGLRVLGGVSIQSGTLVRYFEKFIPTTSYSTVSSIPYGTEPLQKVNLSLPNGTINGVVFNVHGGSWTSASFFIDPLFNESIILAGYILVDCNYRSITSNAFGGNADGQYPNNVNDIATILNFSTVTNAGSSYTLNGTDYWTIIKNYIDQYGYIVMGESSGGHVAVMGAGQHIYNNVGTAPLAVISGAGPMDILPSVDNPDFKASTITNIIDVYCPTNELKTAASPRYKYGTAGNPGLWYNAINSVNTVWYLIANNFDNLIPTSSIINFAYSLPVSKRRFFNLHQLPPGRDPSTEVDHFYRTTLKDVVTYLAPTIFNKYRNIFPNSSTQFTAISLTANVVASNVYANSSAGTVAGNTILMTTDIISSPGNFSNVFYWKVSDASQVKTANIVGTNTGSITISDYTSNTFTIRLAPNAAISTSKFRIDLFDNISYTGNVIARTPNILIYGNGVGA